MTEQAPGADDDQLPEDPEEEAAFRRNRREHGGAPQRLDDDQLARLTEEERVEAGLDDFDPDEVPPATDEPPEPDVTTTDTFEEERAEVRREVGKDELGPVSESEPFPPSRYDRP